METTLNQITTLLIEPPGNLIYHTILMFSVVMALQAALVNSSRMPKPAKGRMVLGLAVVLLFQMAMFIISGLAWQGLINARLVFPPFDRAVLFLSMVWIIWMWAAPENNRFADVAVAITTLLGIVFLFFTVSLWRAEGIAKTYNGTYLDWGWQIATLAVSIIGLIGISLRQPAGRGAGFAFIIIIMAGICFHLVLLQKSANLSGIIRLFSLCAFPLLPVLAQRFTVETNAQTVATTATNKGTEVDNRKRMTSEPRTVSAWLKLANQTDPDQIQIALTRAVSRTLLADFTFLVYIDAEMGSLEIKCGYDLIREEPIAGSRLSFSSVPELVSSIQHGKPLRLSTNGTAPQDLISLTRIFGLNESGHLLAIPLMVSPGVWSAGLVLLTPYSNRLWNAEDQNFLNGMSEAISQVLQRISAINDFRVKDEQSQYEINDLRRQVENLQVEAENLRLAAANQSNQRLPAYEMDKLSDLSTFAELQQEAQNTIQRLQNENDELHRLLVRNGPFAEIPEVPVSTGPDQVKNRVLEPGNHIAVDGWNLDQEESSVGLTDQETDRPATALTHSQDTRDPGVDQLPSMAAFEQIIDQAISATSGLFRDKSITVQIRFPDSLGVVRVNDSVWRQVLVELLQNAAASTPANGIVGLKIEITKTDQPASILSFQITDYCGNNVEGLQVSGEKPDPNQSAMLNIENFDLALSNVKTQVEAHNGSIQWNTTVEGERRVTLHLPVQIGSNE
jgi:signal transduction histidine kinase